MKKPLICKTKPSHKSFITIDAEEVASNANRQICIFEPGCHLNENSGLYFFIVYKEKGPNQYLPIYKSEVKKYGSGESMTWN
jgi:hypothetical protein